VLRGIVEGDVDDPKTLTSQDSLPLAGDLVSLLSEWRRQSPYNGPDDYMFADPLQSGRRPYNPYSLQQRVLRPVGEELGFADTLGWHTFRHTYRTLLDETGAPMSVQQELMRHADIRSTFEYMARRSMTANEQRTIK